MVRDKVSHSYKATILSLNKSSLKQYIQLLSFKKILNGPIHFSLHFQTKIPKLCPTILEILYSNAFSYQPEFDTQQGQNYSVFYSVQVVSGAHLTSYPMGTGGFPGVKAAQACS
jgi:hypothetical protein